VSAFPPYLPIRCFAIFSNPRPFSSFLCLNSPAAVCFPRPDLRFPRSPLQGEEEGEDAHGRADVAHGSPGKLMADSSLHISILNSLLFSRFCALGFAATDRFVVYSCDRCSSIWPNCLYL
jgi:hypothetical protein